ncbi:MAG TPA: hypothetical protein VEK11_12505 [Thermoanaerobaculia bacterium]|jgi:uncharacterized protein YcfL|nr:hypothetical protein [Thermoanaerobaculia bacterium]
MHRAVSILLFLLVACASGSSSRPPSIAEPDIEVRLSQSTFFGSSSSATTTIEVMIGNRANVPITVRRVEIDSPTMVQYRVVRTARDVVQQIAPGESTTVLVMVPIETTTSRPVEPLTLRAIVEMEAGTDRWREIATTG